jgi:hypothetical protein
LLTKEGREPLFVAAKSLIDTLIWFICFLMELLYRFPFKYIVRIECDMRSILTVFSCANRKKNIVPQMP